VDGGEGRHEEPRSGPLLIIDGEKDHTVPWAIANAAYKRQKRNPASPRSRRCPNRGHSLTIDHGWQEVAQTRSTSSSGSSRPTRVELVERPKTGLLAPRRRRLPGFDGAPGGSTHNHPKRLPAGERPVLVDFLDVTCIN
jgi:hypothetical protein